MVKQDDFLNQLYEIALYNNDNNKVLSAWMRVKNGTAMFFYLTSCFKNFINYAVSYLTAITVHTIGKWKTEGKLNVNVIISAFFKSFKLFSQMKDMDHKLVLDLKLTTV